MAKKQIAPGGTKDVREARLSPEQRALAALQERISGCGQLCDQAWVSIKAKIDKMGDGLESSSKLMRAVDDLDIARRAMADIIREICTLTGESADA